MIYKWGVFSSQVPITESLPLRIAMIYEFEKNKDCKFEEKMNFYLVLLGAASKTVPAEPALDGCIGCAIWLVILKGLDGY